ncbi:response regulator [Caulobacter sp. RL271]|jgi:DNA-binding NtrC family response regulator|uniref:Response regulator n=1 Tax=Caulobacter segnis TaxID=88688 RepID=A0ABY4ZTX2_9CAUL|nr:response regulator [Caulobacter segnis]USQ95457.1 response regulator [Caulobacter segnis]
MSQRHALIIEDDCLVALELEYLLKEQGFATVDIADNPRSALDCALTHPPQLITSDYCIVDGTGPDAVAAIEAKLGPMPVVFVSSHPDVLGQARHGHLVVEKPFLPSHIARACLTLTRMVA